ncbi:MAG: DUF2071 domain-containing protein [Actinomycetota bacterium]
MAYRTPEPIPVRRPVMEMEWNRLTFLHWPYEPEIVQALLPEGLEVDTFDGSAWVSLVPFTMVVKAPRFGALPWLSTFPETNVRTYVVGPEGERGIWFFSLEASRLAAVLSARVGYRLPYMWAKMDVHREPHRVRYESRRRWPGPVGAQTIVDVELGDRIVESDLDRFLTARFRLYTLSPLGLSYALADHPSWRLRSAKVLELRDDLVTVAGLPSPDGDPLVHHSPGIQVAVSRPFLARKAHRRDDALPSPA